MAFPLISRIFFLHRGSPFWLQIHLMPLRSSSKRQAYGQFSMRETFSHGYVTAAPRVVETGKGNQISRAQLNTRRGVSEREVIRV